nr:NS4=non-structural protein [maize stripe virus MStV, Peptide Partial, 33 aa] [Tenuivirus zeae]
MALMKLFSRSNGKVLVDDLSEEGQKRLDLANNK